MVAHVVCGGGVLDDSGKEGALACDRSVDESDLLDRGSGVGGIVAMRLRIPVEIGRGQHQDTWPALEPPRPAHDDSCNARNLSKAGAA